MHYLGILSLGAVLFTTTNLDDILVLIGFYSDKAFKSPHIVAGQYAGIAAIVAVSILLAGAIPMADIGLLGIVPLAIGVRKLIARRKSRAGKEPSHEKRPGIQNAFTVAAVTLANGGDNISAYAPIFAQRTHMEVAELCVVFLVMTAAWCALARGLVDHPAAGQWIEKHGGSVLPFVYIGLGVYILMKVSPIAAAFTQLFHG